MHSFAKVLIATLNLLEAEGRAFQRGLLRVWTMLLVTLIAAIVGFTGIASLCVALYWALTTYFNPALGITILGAILLVVAGGLACVVYLLTNRKVRSAEKPTTRSEPVPMDTAESMPAAARN